ncbi:protein YkpC [Metabacillus sp. RGM 3146]
MKDLSRRLIISLLLTGIICGGISISMANLPEPAVHTTGK